MRYIIIIILNLFITNCTTIKNNQKNFDVVVKYYRNIGEICPRISFDEKHIGYNEISNKKAKIEIENLGKMGFPLQNIYKVYFATEKKYEQGIPIKTEAYYMTPKYYALWRYDRFGRVIEYTTESRRGTYTYIESQKNITTIDKRTGRVELSKFYYDKNKQFIKEITLINGKFYSTNIPSKKNPNIIYEYDVKRKIIGKRDATIPCYKYVD